MTAVGSIPAALLQSAPVADRLHTLPRKAQPFDVSLLCAKLEATKREQDARRVRRIKSDASKGAYVPRTAAKQHAVAFGGDGSDRREHARAFPDRQRSQRRSNGYSADGKPCVDPARLRVALDEAIAESCALTDVPSSTIAWADGRPIDTLTSRRSSAGDAQGLTLARRLYDAQHKRSSIDSAAPFTASTQPVANAKRVLVPTKPSSQTLYERVPVTSYRRPSHPNNAIHDDDVPTFNVPPRIPAGGPFNLDMLLHDKDGWPIERPGLHAHDRPHWAQQSECGDSMRDLLHQHNREQYHHHQVKPRPPIAEARMALEGINIQGARPPARRTKSTGEPENLVSEAVAKIKKEEKAKWRRSVAGFFRRP